MASQNTSLLRLCLSFVLLPLLSLSQVSGANTYAISEYDDDFTRDAFGALKVHNWIRSNLKLNPLAWDEGLAEDAQRWANHLARIDNMVHSSGSQRPNAGENLYMVYYSDGGCDYPLTRGSLAWLDEEPLYHNELLPDGDFEGYGHYTQMVWYGTTSMGIATANATSGKQYVVARYSPPGNIVGYRPF